MAQCLYLSNVLSTQAAFGKVLTSAVAGSNLAASTETQFQGMLVVETEIGGIKMFKSELQGLIWVAIAAQCWQFALMLGAIYFAFREFPSHAWTIVVSILFIAALKTATLAGNEYKEKLAMRGRVVQNMTLRRGLVALQRRQLDDHSDETAFWAAMRREVVEDVEFEDSVQEEGAKIDGMRTPGVMMNLGFSVLIDVVIVVAAKFAAGL